VVAQLPGGKIALALGISMIKVHMVVQHDPRTDLTRWQLCLTLNEAERVRRQRFADVALLVAHPNLPLSAAACFEQLRGRQLNLVTSNQALEPTCAATEPSQLQRALLSSLRRTNRIEPEDLSERIEWRRK
jgi:hypothetical protein